MTDFPSRNIDILAAYRAGETAAAIARRLGITRVRVSEIVRKYAGREADRLAAEFELRQIDHWRDIPLRLSGLRTETVHALGGWSHLETNITMGEVADAIASKELHFDCYYSAGKKATEEVNRWFAERGDVRFTIHIPPTAQDRQRDALVKLRARIVKAQDHLATLVARERVEAAALADSTPSAAQ